MSATRTMPVRGRWRENVPLAPRTWLRVGGPAEAWFEPADADDLQAFLAQRPAGLAVTRSGLPPTFWCATAASMAWCCA
jgi:UDP-N-acetylmuramate dehydrogenase